MPGPESTMIFDTFPVAVSSDGFWIATADGDRSVRLWPYDLPTTTRLADPRGAVAGQGRISPTTTRALEFGGVGRGA